MEMFQKNYYKRLYDGCSNTNPVKTRKAAQKLVERHQQGKNLGQLKDQYRFAFHLAVKKDLREVATLLWNSHLFPTDTLDENGDTLLLSACRNQNQELVSALISSGDRSLIGLPNQQQETPLFLTCQQGQREMALQLIDTGHSRPDLPSSLTGETPLMLASLFGWDDLVAKLLDTRQAHPELRDQTGNTALMVACSRGHSATALRLIEAIASARSSHSLNSSLNLVNNRGQTAMTLACCHRLEPVASRLIDLRQAKFPSDYSHSVDTPLMICLQLGLLNLVQRLIETGQGDLRRTDTLGRTALMVACVNKQSAIALQLANHPENPPEAVEKHGQTALMLACAQSMPGVAQALLSTGRARPDHRDQQGHTALGLSLRQHSSTEMIALIRILLSNKEVRQTLGDLDGNGRSMLMVACAHGQEEAAQLILKTGQAKPELQDQNGETALMGACRQRLAKAAQEIVKTGQSQPHLTNRHGETALVIACHHGLAGVVRRLLAQTQAKDLNLMATDLRGKTAEEYAFERGWNEIFEQLSRLRPECSICMEKITKQDNRLLSCEHQFHRSCINKWLNVKPGEFLEESKTQCPMCRKTVNYWGEFRFDFAKNLYRICGGCHRPFEAGEKTCQDRRHEMPDRCDRCRYHAKVACPSCGLQLEHAGGCLDFSCCLYGFDRCTSNGRSCDHGNRRGRSGVHFCGHRWRLEGWQQGAAEERHQRNHQVHLDHVYAQHLAQHFHHHHNHHVHPEFNPELAFMLAATSASGRPIHPFFSGRPIQFARSSRQPVSSSSSSSDAFGF